MGKLKMFCNYIKQTNHNSHKIAARHRMIVHADTGFIGSAANQAIVLSTAIFLAAGRFGYAPSANKPASVGLKLQSRDSGMKSNDPSGFTAVDTLAFGAMGHIFGVGIYLGTAAQNLQ